MESYRVIIIDDEVLSRESIKDLLSEYTEWTIVGEGSNGRDAIRLIEETKPDLVFLDIEMPHLTGMEVINRLEFKPLIVLTTAYDNYAIKAFEENVIDYLLKPYTDKRFHKTLDRVKVKLKEYTSLKKFKKITHVLLDQDLAEIKFPRSFNALIGDTIHIIKEEDIIWVSASGNYVELHTHDKRYLCREKIAEMEGLLNPSVFTRINRSYIVRISEVMQLKKHHSGEYFVILKSNIELKLSRSYKEKVSLFLGRS